MSLIDTAEQFFTHYSNRDVDAMVSLFTDDGTINYYPADLRGRASEAGRGIWGALIDVFPDLTNEVTATYGSADGKSVTVEVTISGTQSKDAFGIKNKGLHYVLPHVFIVHGDEQNRIKHMAAYWDNAGWYSQLGRSHL